MKNRKEIVDILILAKEEYIRRHDRGVLSGMCDCISEAIYRKFGLFPLYHKIPEIIPEFTYEYAKELLNAKKDKDGYWWFRNYDKPRIVFFNHLIELYSNPA